MEKSICDCDLQDLVGLELIQDVRNWKENIIQTYHVLSSSRTSVRVKLGLFNAKIRNENRRYIHRLIYQINEQDLLCHSI